MRKYQLPVFTIVLFSCILLCSGNAIAQKGNPESKKIAIRKLAGFSEFLTTDKFVQYLNNLNEDKGIVYIKYNEEVHPDFIIDIKSDYSFPKKIVKQTFGTLTDLKSPGGAVNSNDEVYVPDYSGETKGIRPIGAYYNNEFSLYHPEEPGWGFGTVVLTIYQPGQGRRQVFKKAVYLEDSTFLVEERLFDGMVTNMFTYFQKAGSSKISLY